MTNTTPTTSTTYPGVDAMRIGVRAARAVDTLPFGIVARAFHDAVTNAYVWSDDHVTFARRNIMRTVRSDHPAAIAVIDAVDNGRTVDPSDAMRGTGRGYPRVDVITPGHVTASGRDRFYVCGGVDGDACVASPDGAPLPVRAFPTLTTPRADGRNRNVAECRACRDHRTSTNRAIRNAGRTDTVDAPTPVIVHTV